MNSKIILYIFALFFIGLVTAQIPNSEIGGGEFIFNPEKKACITPEQRRDLLQNLQTNMRELRRENRLLYSEQQRGNHPLFIWPLQKADNVPYNDVWAISNYVDHDLEFNNSLLDYNCGNQTYDTSNRNHQGLDLYTWPFGWKQMEDNSAEIIAAAGGQIIFKRDGEFDRSCDFSTTTPWNIVVVQHNDGSIALYGHMKNGSTTTKNVGDSVTAGEYLGIVGSSGLSSGPHLHFEVYEGEVNDIPTGLIDPFSGNCNSLNDNSWWANQKPYVNPKINAALTHSQVPNVFPPCPTTETLFLNNDFETIDDFYFAAYLRDQTVGDNISFEIIRPDNSSLFGVWNAAAQVTSSSWYYYYGPYNGYFDMVGEWKWRVTFAGETITHTFNVTDVLSVDKDDFSQTSIFPNPFNNVINISSSRKVVNAHIVDILGKLILTIEDDSNGIHEINTSSVSNGMYFIKLESDANEIKTIKLIKE